MRNWRKTAVMMTLGLCVVGLLCMGRMSSATMGLPEGTLARLGIGIVHSVAYSLDGKWLALVSCHT